MQNVRYVTTIKPVTICKPVRPQEPLREKAKVIYTEGKLQCEENEVKLVRKAIKDSGKLFLYFWAFDSDQQTHYLTRRKCSKCTGSILITDQDIIEKTSNIVDASLLYDHYEMEHDTGLVEKYLGNILEHKLLYI